MSKHTDDGSHYSFSKLSMTTLKTRFIHSINDIDAAIWNELCSTDYPFLRHEFFAALENGGSISDKTGWQPYHLLLESDSRLLGAMPLFLKAHSYGEYVFDWAWADAYHRHGFNYYPKLLNAIPFTPATGPRWSISTELDQSLGLQAMHGAIADAIADMQLSSGHILFATHHASRQWCNLGWLQRTGCQFHWRNQGYRDFADFLDSFTSRKRKTVKKERARVYDQGITMTIKEGADISNEDWRQFYYFYQTTYLKHSGSAGYLTADTFFLLARTMAQYLVLIQAQRDREIIAGALCFRGDGTLYGRYWGCVQEFAHLHFETCYYSGIEYAIDSGLVYFDPGAQGEHKIQRGFQPTLTYSNHWIANNQFRDAIEAFACDEQKNVERYHRQASGRLPFKH